MTPITTLVLCATLLVSTTPVQAALVPDRSSGVVYGSDIEKVPHKEDDVLVLFNSHLDNHVQNFEWGPKQVKRKGAFRHKINDKHDTRHGGDETHLFYMNDGDSFVHEKTWRGNKCDTSPIPVPGAAWLLISGLIGLFAIAQTKN